MKRAKRIMICVGCAVLLLISWVVAVTAKTDAQKQEELLAQASDYIADEIYILAVPLLEEASSYEDAHTLEAETTLKDVYLKLIDQTGFRNKYTALLEKQMARDGAAPEVFAEAAQYYMERSRVRQALAILRNGVEETASEYLKDLYEKQRYAFRAGREVYQDVTELCGGAIQVKQGDKWGLATAKGGLNVPCEYDWVSTYENNRAIVRKNEVISAVDGNNNRVALLHGSAFAQSGVEQDNGASGTVENFGNYADDRLGLKTENGWILANGEFATASTVFEEIGMYRNGYAPAKLDGKWGLLDTSGTEWLLAPEYDAIVQDMLGRSYDQGAVFVVRNGRTLLLVDGEQVGDTYEDARPFNGGWAAVKKNGKWGFIDTAGTVQIDYQFDDAMSFGQHLAAVKQGEKWGYISLYGEMMIAPEFMEARSFSNGSAPVKTSEGWKFITLIEYEEAAGL